MQVSTLLPALQPKTMVGDSLLAVISEKTTKVAAGSMFVLKVNTTAAPGETPVAPLVGTVETIVGCATARRGLASIRSRIRAGYKRVFISLANLISRQSPTATLRDSFMLNGQFKHGNGWVQHFTGTETQRELCKFDTPDGEFAGGEDSLANK